MDYQLIHFKYYFDFYLCDFYDKQSTLIDRVAACDY